MKSKAKIQLLLLLILLISIAILFQVKNLVIMSEKELRDTKNKLLKAEQNEAVLKAEYSHLNDPQKINKIIQDNLNLRLIKTDDVIDY